MPSVQTGIGSTHPICAGFVRSVHAGKPAIATRIGPALSPVVTGNQFGNMPVALPMPFQELPPRPHVSTWGPWSSSIGRAGLVEPLWTGPVRHARPARPVVFAVLSSYSIVTEL